MFELCIQSCGWWSDLIKTGAFKRLTFNYVPLFKPVGLVISLYFYKNFFIFYFYRLVLMSFFPFSANVMQRSVQFEQVSCDDVWCLAYRYLGLKKRQNQFKPVKPYQVAKYGKQRMFTWNENLNTPLRTRIICPGIRNFSRIRGCHPTEDIFLTHA